MNEATVTSSEAEVVDIRGVWQPEVEVTEFDVHITDTDMCTTISSSSA